MEEPLRRLAGGEQGKLEEPRGREVTRLAAGGRWREPESAFSAHADIIVLLRASVNCDCSISLPAELPKPFAQRAPVEPAGPSHAEEPQIAAFYRDLVAELRAIPGVERAGAGFPLPLSGRNFILALVLEGKPEPPPGQEPSANVRFVTPGYLETLAIPRRRGRSGVLLVSHYRHLMAEEGLRLAEAVVQGSRERLALVLMTALTAGLALIPLVLAGDRAGNEIQSPMAQVILGCLLSSTFLNLILVPALFARWDRERDGRGRGGA